jgi:hypothetical protein
LGAGLNGDVRAIAVQPNGVVIVGGQFVSAGGAASYNVARWDGLSWSPLEPGLNDTVNALVAIGERDLMAGGSFGVTMDGTVSYGWAHWTDTGIPWAAEDPTSRAATSGSTLTLPATCAAGFDFNGPVTFRWQRNGTDIANGPGGASSGGGTVSGASGSLTSANTTTTLTITGIRPSDAGQYTVLFTNSCGTGISLPSTVTVSSGCPADLNGDTFVNGDDLGLLLTSWGACAGCTADLNADGFVNGDDLGQLLVAWGACGG